jgi:glycosyltransferase involved in cell wall biosynthesis
MDILHLNRSDDMGGASQAAYRLHRGLVDQGVGSRMLVQRRLRDDPTVEGPSGAAGSLNDRIRKKISQVPLLRYPNRKSRTFSPAWLPELRGRAVNRRDPDVVHLHWVGAGSIRPSTISEFRAPLVWTLHDMWPFTGGCHYAEDCTRFTGHCGDCPLLASGREQDLSHDLFRRKQDAWEEVSFTIVAPSKWLAEQARQSTLFAEADIQVVPNGLDTNAFRPRESSRIRDRFGLPLDARLVGFGAALDSHRKGGDLLIEALGDVSLPDDVHLVTFGNVTNGFERLGVPVTRLGFIQQSDLERLYSELSVMVVPSRQEAFGQTASEAMASGTPVVAFGATGLRDIVRHRETGYLAEPYDAADLAHGIEWVLSDHNRSRELGREGRRIAERQFDIENVAAEYIEIYRSVLS